MFESLLNLVKENAGSAIVNNSAIPNEKNNEAINTTTSSIMNALKGQLSSGNMNSLLDMFNTSTPENPEITNAVKQNVTNDLSKNLNINTAQAGNIASSLIPTILNKLVSKTNDKNDNSFDFNGIINSLGGKIDGAGGMIGNIFK